MKKALVIGATGIIGNHVLRALLKRGIAVRVFSRGLTSSLNLEGLDVEKMKGDLNDPFSIAQAMKGCDTVFHTAPYYPLHMFDVEGQVKKAKEGILTVLQAASQVSLERFIYTSSLTTIGRAKPGELADENCLYDETQKPLHPYFAIKPVMENEVKKWALDNRVPAVIVNPTGCFGDFELKPPALCIIPQIANKKIPAYINALINVVDTADVGEGQVLAALKGRIGERYILGGHNADVEWLLQKISAAAHVSPPKVKVPYAVALIPSIISEYWAHYVTKGVPALTSLGIRFMQYGQHLSSEKAKKELGYTFAPMEACFERALAWYQKIGYC